MSVDVDASVQDAKGRYPAHLTAADFRVFENDAAQAIDA